MTYHHPYETKTPRQVNLGSDSIPCPCRPTGFVSAWTQRVRRGGGEGGYCNQRVRLGDGGKDEVELWLLKLVCQ